MREMTLTYPRQLFSRWKRTRLCDAWFWQYRELFEEKDLSNAQRQHRRGYHFAEWYTAIHFAHRGFDVLTTKYSRKDRPRKNKKATEWLGQAAMNFLLGQYRPDLLIRDPRKGESFFVEVKRDKDKLSQGQIRSFRSIERVLNRKVLVVRLRAT